MAAVCSSESSLPLALDVRYDEKKCLPAAMYKHILTILVALLCTAEISLAAKPERFSYKGTTYQVVEVTNVKGSEVTLRTDKGEEVLSLIHI